VRAAGSAYAARVSLDQIRMQIDDKQLNPSPGTRRMIDYLLSPILRHSQESLRER
jgi:hemolysin D